MKALIPIVFSSLGLMLGTSQETFAVWPPSTAFQAETSSLSYGLVVVALFVGIAIGVWAQRKNHEHK